MSANYNSFNKTTILGIYLNHFCVIQVVCARNMEYKTGTVSCCLLRYLLLRFTCCNAK